MILGSMDISLLLPFHVVARTKREMSPINVSEEDSFIGYKTQFLPHYHVSVEEEVTGWYSG